MYETIRNKISALLAGPFVEAFKAVDCRTPQYDSPPLPAAQAFRATVQIGHVTGTPDARYLIEALGSRLELYLQLNVYRLVVVYRIPAQGTLDSAALQPRFARWAIGATDAGWTIGWRDAIDAGDEAGRFIEVYGYASLPVDFLDDERHQLYWITDVVQMTRSFLLEARRAGVEFPPCPRP
ncbi:MAG TPA: hypothetical protein VFF19_00905 [Reyranella sp.]|jgi:hypothetical protein|nr:hypothetical protein [Reyranella sp.]